MDDKRIAQMTYLRMEQYIKLKELSESTKVPMAAMIRDAIDEYFEKIGK